MTAATNLDDSNPLIATMIGPSASHCLSPLLPRHDVRRSTACLALALVLDRLVQQKDHDL